MSNEIATLGHASRAAAIRSLAETERLSHERIAERLGIEKREVYVVLQRDLMPRPPAEPRKPHRAVIDPDKIVSGVLPRGVPVRRAPPPPSPEAWGRTIQAMNTTRYRLRRADGQYLRLDAGGFVAGTAHAWIGFRRQLEALQKRPELAGLAVVPVPPPRGSYREALIVR